MRSVASQMAAIDPSLAPSDVDWLTAFDEDVIRREWEKMDHVGVELLNVKTETRDGWKFMRASIQFNTLQNLLDCGMLVDSHISLSRGPGGQYGYEQSINTVSAMKSLPPGMDMASLQPMLAVLLRDFRAVLSVHTPGAILRSNADRVEGSRAIWEYHGQQTDIITRLQNLEMRVMFDGRGLTIAEARSDH